ncbi:uncharacterized protein QC763_702228 [Podospora pseudopauciseta]|uniref:2EXR domain-containing protein n=1 Tax=Podospora pseudopauciseta TaxID=2093780 RepID=A0ABR0H0L3_9PEZI|nr:hypothetical protein QC763_702228 [Podospora pseudopauciseta]
MTTESAANLQTFHHFPLLPFEIRLEIWELTAFPRRLRALRASKTYDTAVGPPPIPAPLHTCSEARSFLTSCHPPVYQKMYLDCTPHDDNQESSSHRKYTWANWELDTLVLEDSLHTVVVDHIATMLMPRRLAVPCLKGYVSNFLFELIDKLKSVKEVELLLDDVDSPFDRSSWEAGWHGPAMECDFGHIETFWLVHDGGRRRWAKWDEWRAEKRWEFDEDDLDEALMETFKELRMTIPGWKPFGSPARDIDADIRFT